MRSRFLLGPAFEALREHRDGDNPGRKIGAVTQAENRIERPFVFAAESRADHVLWRGNHPETFALGRDYLDAGIRSDVDAAHGIDGAAVTAAAELRELPLIRQGAIWLHIESR